MKAVLLAGGYGTRISEESGIRPKPMVEIGGKPILWHIMKIYSSYGINEFIICCGYKGHMIKEYFANYALYNSDVTFDMRTNSMEVHKNNTEDWKVTLVHTGQNSMTGGRLKRVKDYIGNETFCLTYGDGLSDIDITASIKFHQEQGTLATLTAVQQPGRFGTFNLGNSDARINTFMEKPTGGEMPWINGGFFVLEPGVIDYIDGDDTTWEREPLEGLARDGELSAYRHTGFWQPMDTLRDKVVLEEMWQSGKAPWYSRIFSDSLARANSY
ncbi:glucose-1-phosphate cytidylyltransferase [Adhaeribacter rhizoryzae]|uniref:Glucose-1-phosphate cytidylyltransferase n=1 Tax=Adhaeribacter rhizoryzae TaxID=2607907 RepID=A0A5M6DMN4_9BACT|nr:glucose-1-phosphate cytidylyltransferase [Adhaeribacter rhizoryzae]KAA5548781.1 glucose-1-phosphate cytidylyltransferase [Adhaeribacter rhizoryzae]